MQINVTRHLLLSLLQEKNWSGNFKFSSFFYYFVFVKFFYIANFSFCGLNLTQIANIPKHTQIFSINFYFVSCRFKSEIMVEVEQELLVTKTVQEVEKVKDVNFIGLYITSEEKVNSISKNNTHTKNNITKERQTFF